MVLSASACAAIKAKDTAAQHSSISISISSSGSSRLGKLTQGQSVGWSGGKKANEKKNKIEKKTTMTTAETRSSEPSRVVELEPGEGHGMSPTAPASSSLSLSLSDYW